MKPSRLIALAATAGSVATRRTLRAVVLRPDPMALRGFLAVAVAAFGVVITPPAIADKGCGHGEPPLGAASKDVSDVYGQPATL